MFGTVAVIAELARLLQLPDTWVTICDAIARAFALTTVFMAVRMVFILILRGTRRLFGRGGTVSDAHGQAN